LSGKYKFPDFREKCPLCSRKNCAVKNCRYYRKWGDIWIQCYLCQNPPPKGHKTFSLLPWPLIPYHKYTVDDLYIIDDAAHEEQSILKACYSIEDCLNTESSFNGSIKSYRQILAAAELKWDIFRKQKHWTTKLNEVPRSELASRALLYFEAMLDFLYGIPSQKRVRNPKQPQGP